LLVWCPGRLLLPRGLPGSLCEESYLMTDTEQAEQARDLAEQDRLTADRCMMNCQSLIKQAHQALTFIPKNGRARDVWGVEFTMARLLHRFVHETGIDTDDLFRRLRAEMDCCERDCQLDAILREKRRVARQPSVEETAA